jgi:hypothetical protein
MLPEPVLLACAVMPPQVMFSPRVKDEAAADPRIATSTPLTHASVYGPVLTVPQRFGVVVFQVPLPLAALPFADQNRLAAKTDGAVKWLINATEKATAKEEWQRGNVNFRGFIELDFGFFQAGPPLRRVTVASRVEPADLTQALVWI